MRKRQAANNAASPCHPRLAQPRWPNKPLIQFTKNFGRPHCPGQKAGSIAAYDGFRPWRGAEKGQNPPTGFPSRLNGYRVFRFSSPPVLTVLGRKPSCRPRTRRTSMDAADKSAEAARIAGVKKSAARRAQDRRDDRGRERRDHGDFRMAQHQTGRALHARCGARPNWTRKRWRLWTKPELLFPHLVKRCGRQGENVRKINADLCRWWRMQPGETPVCVECGGEKLDLGAGRGALM